MNGAEALKGLASLLLPRGCLVCRAWVGEGGADSLLCGPCRSRLGTATWPRCPRCHHPTGTGRVATDDCLECSEWPEDLSGARYAFVLESPASEMVHSLKYEGWARLGEEMGRAVAGAVADVAGAARDPVLVPIPTTDERLRRRGYNQAAVLAAAAGRVLDVRVEEALVRLASGRSQTSLDPGQRRDNVRDAFRLSPIAQSVHGATVLLIDDVLTTGSTAAAAAGVLRSGGADQVVVATFARAMPRRPAGRRRSRSVILKV